MTRSSFAIFVCKDLGEDRKMLRFQLNLGKRKKSKRQQHAIIKEGSTKYTNPQTEP